MVSPLSEKSSDIFRREASEGHQVHDDSNMCA